MATAPFRIYIVTNGDNESRLVKAQNPQQALSHVAASTFTVRKATVEDGIEAATSGIKVEQYKDTNQNELEFGE